MHRLTVLFCFAAWLALAPFTTTAQTASAPATQAAPFTFIPSDFLNRSLPHWLSFSGEERFRLEGFSGAGFRDSSDLYVLNRLRVNMLFRPVSWLRFNFQMQDSRVAFKSLKPYAPPYQDTFDLRQAYVEIGDWEKQPVSFRVGRQEINLGDERLVGSSDFSNTARSFDAMRLSLHQGKFRLEAFAATPVVLHEGAVGYEVAGNYLHGLYGGLEKIVPDSRIEPYLFWRLQNGQKTEAGTTGRLNFTTAGVRWLGKLPDRFDYSMEMARQQGTLGTDSIAAWAGHWMVGRTFSGDWKPRPFTEFSYATGDHNPADGRRQTFDELFPTAHEKYGLADQVGWRNIQHVRGGVELTPSARLKAAAKFGAYWLADPHDALYNSSGTPIVRGSSGSAGRFVGSEIDASLTYILSRQCRLGSGFARLFTGTFLKRSTPGRDYNYPYLMFTVLL